MPHQNTEARPTAVETGTDTDLSTGTVANNDQLPTDFRHNIDYEMRYLSCVRGKTLAEEKVRAGDVSEKGYTTTT